jgi:histone-binding protein RBBP4
VLNEESKIWKKNAPYLYDCCITHVLEWPSMTVQWLPFVDQSEESKFIRNKMIIGTQTSGEESNYLMIAQVRLPNEAANIEAEDFKLTEKHEGQSTNNNSLNIETRILHEGEVNKAQFMPQKYNIIATKTNSGEVHIFDYSLHHAKPQTSEVRPELRLTGHTKVGFGLSWNEKKEGFLVSGSDDNKICIWDINSAKELRSSLQPLHDINYHSKAVNVGLSHIGCKVP